MVTHLQSQNLGDRGRRIRSSRLFSALEGGQDQGGLHKKTLSTKTKQPKSRKDRRNGLKVSREKIPWAFANLEDEGLQDGCLGQGEEGVTWTELQPSICPRLLSTPQSTSVSSCSSLSPRALRSWPSCKICSGRNPRGAPHN